MFLAYVSLFEAETDKGRVPYINLGQPPRDQFILCTELGSLVGLGTKTECPGFHFVMTPGDTMSINYH